MAKSLSILGAVVLLAVLGTGCANQEKKFGRGVNNIFEPIRLAEMGRSIEQTSMVNQEDGIHYHTGVVRGFNKTVVRTSVGAYEIITFLFPPYGPVFTDYMAPNPQYKDSYKPGLFEDSIFATDTAIGFSGGDVAPFMPGSRFRIFDN